MELDQIFSSFSNQTIVAIGDVMVDSYLFGAVHRISPEAPVPVVSVSGRENRLGGAANVALNLRSLGVRPILCSIIGDDEKGRIFSDLMREAGLSTEGIITSPERKTTCKTRIIAGTQHTLRVDDEVSTPVSADLETVLISRVAEIAEMTKIDAIIFEDYDKGALTPRIITDIIDIAQHYGIPTLVDPKKRNFDHYAGVTLFKPNFKELTDGMKLEMEKTDFDAIAASCNAFQEQHRIQFMLVTLSEMGVLISSRDGYHRMKAKIRQIADVSGAGDTVISVAAACLAAGIAPQDIANIANIAGGLVCEQSGVVPIDKELLLSEIKLHA